MKNLFFIFFIAYSGGLFAQPGGSAYFPEQDRCGALNVCNYHLWVRGNYKGYGNVREFGYEQNAFWLKLRIATPGIIQFIVTQDNPVDKFTYYIFNGTGQDCSDDTTALLPIRTAQTMSGGKLYLVNNAINNNAINASEGDVYYIMIDGYGPGSVFPPAGPLHYVATGGITIDFTGTTALFYTENPPVMDSIEASCVTKSRLNLHLSKQVKCSSIAPDGSDFEITPQVPNGTITVAKGNNCTQYPDGYTDEVILWFQGNIDMPGAYQLHAKTGSDGNTLIDMCDQQMPIPDALTFNIPALESVEHKIICTQEMPYTWNGITVNQTGDSVAVFHYYDSIGCAATAYLNLETADTLWDTANAFVCAEQLPYTWNGILINEAGDNAAIYNTPAVGGCDSATVLNLYMINPVAVTETLSGCGSLEYNGNTYTQNAILYDTIESAYGCDSVYRTTNITVYPAIVPQSVSKDTMGCGFLIFNDHTYIQDTVLYDTAYNVYGCDSIYYTWHVKVFPNTQPVQQLDTIIGCKYLEYKGHYYDSDTTVNEIFQNVIGCDSFLLTTFIDIQDLYLNIDVEPSEPVNGDIIELTTIANVPDYSVISWSPYDLFQDQHSRRQRIKIDGPGLFEVVAAMPSGCSDTAQIYVNTDSLIPEVQMPTAFTPNNDGINDVFKPVFANKSGHTINSFRVFDRFGALVYSDFQNKHPEWNGEYGNNGAQLPLGTYYYIIDITFVDGKHTVLKGDVTLIR